MDRHRKLEPLLPTDPCACGGSAQGSSGGSCAAKLPLGVEEEAVLRQMRQVHAEARQVRQELLALTPEQSVRQEGLTCHLEELRGRFAALREELARANTLKLQRLGHAL